MLKHCGLHYLFNVKYNYRERFIISNDFILYNHLKFYILYNAYNMYSFRTVY